MTLLSNSQNWQIVEIDNIIFNGNVLGQVWHTFHFILISFHLFLQLFIFFSQTNTNEEYKFQIHNLNQIYK